MLLGVEFLIFFYTKKMQEMLNLEPNFGFTCASEILKHLY